MYICYSESRGCQLSTMRSKWRGLALTHFNLRNGNKVLRYSAECQQYHPFAKRPDQLGGLAALVCDSKHDNLLLPGAINDVKGETLQSGFVDVGRANTIDRVRID